MTVSESETDENTEGTADAEVTEEKSQDGSESKQSMNREVIQNIPITLAIEVGRASLKIRDLMRLTQGSVVELDRLAGEPLDIVVNDTVVAQGEVVLVNDRYGVRLTKVVSAADRIKNL
jgi:flagellar motor switch protein FliN/FliY